MSSTDLCRLATISSNGWPHVVPVSYVYDGSVFYVPSVRNSRKTRNLLRDGRAAIVIDDEASEKGIMVECHSSMLEGEEAEGWRRHMREVKSWENDVQTAVIRLTPVRKASWFLKD